MAIQQVVPVYINLVGDGSSTVFTFALSQMYQNGLSGSQPIGVTGVVPSNVSIPNPPVPVTSVTIDSFGNITITLTSALGNNVTQQFEVDLTFTSGLALSDSTTTSTSVSAMNTTAAVSLTTTTSVQVSMEGKNSAAATVTSVGTGGQFIFEGSVDGTNWFGIDAYNEVAEAWATGTLTAAGSWWMEPLGAMQYVRLRCTVAPSAGAITGTLLASSQVMGTFEFQSANGAVAPNNSVIVGGTDGTNVRTLSTDTSGNLNVISPDTSTASTALNALNATIQVALKGQVTAGFQLAAGTLIGTIVPELSFDGGTTWILTQFKDPIRDSYFNQYIFTAANTQTNAAIDLSGGATHARVRVSAFTSGTANAVMLASKIGPTITTVSLIDGQKVSYSASVRNFTTVASATSPIVVFTGSATKICRITKITWSWTAVTGSTTFADWSVQRFSVITGGTIATTATAAKYDINDPAATATVAQYSTVPTTATANGGIQFTQKFQWATASATVVSPPGFTVVFGSQPGTREIVLRGTSDFIGILVSSIGTTPLTSITIEWTEE